MGKRGSQPRQLTDEEIKYIEDYAALSTVEGLCNYLSMSTKSFYNILNRDERVRKVFYASKNKAEVNVGSALYRSAIEGSVDAMKFYLRTRCRWTEQAHYLEYLLTLPQADFVLEEQKILEVIEKCYERFDQQNR